MSLNPNVVLAAIVAVVFIGGGLLVAVFLAGGSDSAILARAGIIAAMVAPTVTSLLALLAVNRTHEQTVTVQKLANGHSTQLGAVQDRLVELETKITPAPPTA